MNKIRYIAAALALALAATASAVSPGESKVALKATADMSLGNELNTGSALAGLSTSSSGSGFGIDLGWRFWSRLRNSLEINIGVGYGYTTLSADLEHMDYHYSAPSSADMDGVDYIRYYEIDRLHQKVTASRVYIPLYLNYRYQLSKVVGLHALAGVRLGINVSTKLRESSGDAFSYGVYPIYDDLMIDAPYMNEFGSSTFGPAQTFSPEVNKLTTSAMVGAGAEFNLGGPLALDLSVRYEGGLNDMFKKSTFSPASLDAANAPVRYTVAEGQTVAPLAGYLTSSKLSRLSVAIALICRF